MSDNKLLDLSVEFAISAVNLADNIKTPKCSYLIDQFARAGTSFCGQAICVLTDMWSIGRLREVSVQEILCCISMRSPCSPIQYIILQTIILYINALDLLLIIDIDENQRL